MARVGAFWRGEAAPVHAGGFFFEPNERATGLAAPKSKIQFNGVGGLRTYITFTHSAFYARRGAFCFGAMQIARRQAPAHYFHRTRGDCAARSQTHGRGPRAGSAAMVTNRAR
jgi:hypothetical protein